ncbi:hypothetical protein U9M48_021862 [Paspalum notatum var. saurae]|uniref:F-box domain-containing protein n=1 Tax=Paspalum notatum var. saurae TaxID=547442 RepID=A0AAQ3TGJ8_PASNO
MPYRQGAAAACTVRRAALVFSPPENTRKQALLAGSLLQASFLYRPFHSRPPAVSPSRFSLQSGRGSLSISGVASRRSKLEFGPSSPHHQSGGRARVMGECEDAGEYRCWEELLPDALGLIFRNLPLQEVLTVLPRVCKSWGRVVAGPYCWQEIDIEEWSQQQSKPEQIGRMVELLVRRSGGSCSRISVSGLPCDPLFSFIGENARALRTLEIPRSEISDSVVETVAPRLPNVTFLDISSCTKIGARALEAFGKHCKSLVGLRRVMHPIDLVDKVCQHDEARAIARSMPKLRHLEMGYMLITTEAVVEILGQCRELMFLDLRGCWTVDDKFVRERRPGLHVLGPLVDDDCYENSYWEECSDYSDDSSIYSWEFMDDVDEYYAVGSDDEAIWDDGQGLENLEVRFYGGGFGESYSGFDWPPSP